MTRGTDLSNFERQFINGEAASVRTITEVAPAFRSMKMMSVNRAENRSARSITQILVMLV